MFLIHKLPTKGLVVREAFQCKVSSWFNELINPQSVMNKLDGQVWEKILVITQLIF